MGSQGMGKHKIFYSALQNVLLIFKLRTYDVIHLHICVTARTRNPLKPDLTR